MSSALDSYISAGQHSIQANRDLVVASFALFGSLWAEAIAPFYRCAWDALDMCAKIAMPSMRPADVVQLGALRDARLRKIERRNAAIARG